MIKFYGYKRCSTSKKAQKWFDIHNIFYQYQDLVEKPPKQEDLLKWLTKFQDRGLRYFFNTSGQVYRQMKLKNQINNMSIDEAAKLLSQNGKLIKRPLVTDGQKLTCGFKENIYEETWL
jgi:transcriptional regulator, Spx/MgsR family